MKWFCIKAIQAPIIVPETSVVYVSFGTEHDGGHLVVVNDAVFAGEVTLAGDVDKATDWALEIMDSDYYNPRV
jgi:hypothetical protein